MALPLLQNFESGVNGNAITTGNSGGSGNSAWDAVTTTNSATALYTSTAAHGLLGGAFATTATAGQAFCQWAASVGTISFMYGRVYVNPSASPATTDAIIQMKGTSGSSAGNIQLNTSRQLVAQTPSFANAFTFTTAIPTGAFSRVEWFILAGSAGSAQLTVNLYTTQDSTTVTETHTDTTNAWGGTSGFAELDFGWTNSHASQPSLVLDSILITQAGYPGPDLPPVSTFPPLAPSPPYQLRFRHGSRPRLLLAVPQPNIVLLLSDTDASGTSVDAGELISPTSAATMTSQPGMAQPGLMWPGSPGSPLGQPGSDVSELSTSRDGGESIVATVPVSDAVTGTDSVPSIRILPASGETATGTDTSVVVVSDTDAGGAAAEVVPFIIVSDTDQSFSVDDLNPDDPVIVVDSDTVQGTDGAETIAATLSDTEQSYSTDGHGQPAYVAGPFIPGQAVPGAAVPGRTGAIPGQVINAAISDGDASLGNAFDAGEQITVFSSGTPNLVTPPSWRAAFKHTSRPAIPQPRPLNATVISQDAATGTEFSTITVLDSDVRPQANDGGEHIFVSSQTVTDTDASTSTEAVTFLGFAPNMAITQMPSPSFLAAFRHTLQPRTPLTFISTFATISDTDSVTGTDSGRPVGAVDTDTVLGTDSGFSNIVDSDSSVATELVSPFRMSDIDFEGPAQDLELTAWPSDSDLENAQEFAYWTGPLSDTDASNPASDRELPFHMIDFETCTGTESQVIGIYTFQPPFRWTGGGYMIAFGERVIWQGEFPDKSVLELAKSLGESRSVEFIHDGDACRAEDAEEPLLGITVHLTAALEVRLGVSLCPGVSFSPRAALRQAQPASRRHTPPMSRQATSSSRLLPGVPVLPSRFQRSRMAPAIR